MKFPKLKIIPKNVHDFTILKIIHKNRTLGKKKSLPRKNPLKSMPRFLKSVLTKPIELSYIMPYLKHICV